MAGVGDVINDLYTSYAPALAASAATPLNSDEEYMSLTELKFLLMNIHELLDQQLYQSYSRSDAMTVEVSSNTVNKNIIDRKNLIERKNDVLKKINEVLTHSLTHLLTHSPNHLVESVLSGSS
jgi:translation initiation factor 2B subunit (eIF-2B alpha/beta/delta family)